VQTPNRRGERGGLDPANLSGPPRRQRAWRCASRWRCARPTHQLGCIAPLHTHTPTITTHRSPLTPHSLPPPTLSATARACRGRVIFPAKWPFSRPSPPIEEFSEEPATSCVLALRPGRAGRRPAVTIDFMPRQSHRARPIHLVRCPDFLGKEGTLPASQQFSPSSLAGEGRWGLPQPFSPPLAGQARTVEPHSASHPAWRTWRA
jgi:hypothetical protein